MGYPTPVGGRTLGRVARAAQDRAVADVEGRTTSGERDDVVDGQVGRRVGGPLVARAPVAVLATPGAEHAGAETLPCPRAVEGVVPAAVGQAGVLGAATTSAAGDDTADRAQLHPRIVDGRAGEVYSPAVLRLRDHGARLMGRWPAIAASRHPTRGHVTVTHDDARDRKGRSWFKRLNGEDEVDVDLLGTGSPSVLVGTHEGLSILADDLQVDPVRDEDVRACVVRQRRGHLAQDAVGQDGLARGRPRSAPRGWA